MEAVRQWWPMWSLTHSPKPAGFIATQLFSRGKNENLDFPIKPDLHMSPHCAGRTDPQTDLCLLAARFSSFLKLVMLKPAVLFREGNELPVFSGSEQAAVQRRQSGWF